MTAPYGVDMRMCCFLLMLAAAAASLSDPKTPNTRSECDSTTIQSTDNNVAQQLIKSFQSNTTVN